MKIIISALAFTVCSIVFAQTEIKEKVVNSADSETHLYSMMNGDGLRFQTEYRIGRDLKSGAVWCGDRTAATTGISTGSGWYSSGSIQILINGKPIIRPAEKIFTEKGRLIFIWPEARLTLAFPKGSQSLLGEVSAARGTKLSIAFLAFPGYRSRRTVYEPWISSGEVNAKIRDGIPESPSPWIMCYDGVENPRGLCALVVDPENTGRRAFYGTPSGPVIRLLFDSKKESFRFRLWGIPSGKMEAESLRDDLAENVRTHLEFLRSFKFQE